MKEVDIKLEAMFNALHISRYYTLDDFKKASSGDLKNKPWFVNCRGDRPPRIRFLGKQLPIYKQLYRYFIGPLPKGRLKPLHNKEDYNPWHWKENVVEILEPSREAKLSKAAEDIITFVTQKQLAGIKDPWGMIMDFYEPEEIKEAREALNAK